jgi:hypothetical protein
MSPGIVDGLLQTGGYAAALLATLPGATAEAVTSRQANDHGGRGGTRPEGRNVPFVQTGGRAGRVPAVPGYRAAVSGTVTSADE